MLNHTIIEKYLVIYKFLPYVNECPTILQPVDSSLLCCDMNTHTMPQKLPITWVGFGEYK